jgi:hypothetical protein
MRDPAEGFAVLSDLLKPGGLARIALYSAAAREPFAPMMQLAMQKYGKDAASIRRFRQDAPKKFKSALMDRINHIRDYYIMSETRDFLFNVMEHQVDVPQIKAWLDRFGLDFMKFQLSSKVYEEYRKAYPDDPTGAKLENWAAFEKAHPATFLETYAFWCRRKA